MFHYFHNNWKLNRPGSSDWRMQQSPVNSKKSVRGVATKTFFGASWAYISRKYRTPMLFNHPLSFPDTMFIVLIWLSRPSAHKGRGVSSRSAGGLFRNQGPISQLTGLRSIGVTARWEKLVDISFGTVNTNTHRPMGHIK